jgi:hypothetical protein
MLGAFGVLATPIAFGMVAFGIVVFGMLIFGAVALVTLTAIVMTPYLIALLIAPFNPTEGYLACTAARTLAFCAELPNWLTRASALRAWDLSCMG